ncbi:cation:proton antiporter [Methylopila sp. Yamaguchi]|uniref:cation:proton antiporter n=1 Tax=Methylopila sp. Yamaguchi TaxID=1437817 RepID=UPI000CB330E5|nr:cation:proton antiporter [Methylopila sp. Yamaguchi]GBD49876.1 sodium/hydrogen exchanger [Methylopila sp. Yamaguchi]
MSVALVVLIIALLLVAVSLAEPVAARLRLPASVLLAIFGVAIGALALALRSGSFGAKAQDVAAAVTNLPLGSDAFLFLFLPVLLFQSAMNTDARQLAEDASSIFTLAIVAVVVSTFVIGFALALFAPMPLLACLLVGAIVATTDPIAVIGIFREAGAPGRLVRLVEGESLLNDAAAITLFALFLDLIVSGRAFDPAQTAVQAVALPLGGVALGAVAGRLAASLAGRLRESPLAPTSVSVALPYVAFVVAEHTLHVSGVMAVVGAGVTFAMYGPAKAPPDVWRHLRTVWEQIDWWAASLIFVLSSILAPKLIAGATLQDLVLLGVVVLASLAARAAIVFGLMPAMSTLRIGPQISAPFRWVVLWGGLRGATTLVLALAVTEREELSPEIRSFVAVLATGYVFYTLLVQGTTLRALVRRTGVDRLSPVDLALRRDVLAAARRHVAEKVDETARAHGLTAPERTRAEAARADGSTATADPAERVAIALATLARAEREIILQRVRERSVSLKLVDRLLGDARRLGDRSRASGAEGYAEADAYALRFSGAERAAQRIARATGWTGWLARVMADRFEMLLVTSAAVARLEPFARETIAPVLGPDAAAAASAALSRRRETVGRALAALRLQYPGYAEALERRLLANAAIQIEESEYDRMLEDGLIGPELHRDLVIEVGRRRRGVGARPALDLGLDPETLVARLPLFADLPDDALKQLVRLIEPVFVRPGERLIRRGDRGDAAYFVSSGAVEVTSVSGSTYRLGRGEIFGEIALLTDSPRTADVDAIAYCSLLRLGRRAFLAFLDDHPSLAAEVAATAERRRRENAAATSAAAMS